MAVKTRAKSSTSTKSRATRTTVLPSRKSTRRILRTSAIGALSAGKAELELKQKTAKVGKMIYFFGGGKAEGKATQSDLLGGKGAGLAEMTNQGLPVPPGFTITTAVCNLFYDYNMRAPDGLDADMQKAVGKVETLMGTRFGDSAPTGASSRRPPHPRP